MLLLRTWLSKILMQIVLINEHLQVCVTLGSFWSEEDFRRRTSTRKFTFQSMELEHACAVSCPSRVGERELVAMAISSPLLLGFNPSERQTFYLLLSISRFLSFFPPIASMCCHVTSGASVRLLRSGVSRVLPRPSRQRRNVAWHLRGGGGGRAPAPSGISHCSSVARFACFPPHRLGRCGCHGDAGRSHRSALHAHTRALLITA